jgi:hypothetical protein
MRSKTFYRVRFGVRLLFWGSLVAGLFYVVGNLWWVGDGYCWGSMIECHFPESEGGK